MYDKLIEKYIKKLSLDDINFFAKKNNIILKENEDNVIFEFIKKNWKEIYNGNTNLFIELKNQISTETYYEVMILYNKYKVFKK